MNVATLLESAEGPASQAPLVCFVTAGADAEARRIGYTLVEERLAACVNVLSGVRSIYPWQGAVAESEEVLLIIKTTAASFERLATRIRSLHSYDVPEIIACAVDRGDSAYLAWLTAAVSAS